MTVSDDFRRVLDELDVEGARQLWQNIAPGAPQPESNAEVLVTLHYARTKAWVISFRQRAYSHRYLLDHSLPSGLPDVLRPRAERMYPSITEGVGSGALAPKPYSHLLQRATTDAIQDVYANEGAHPPVDLVKRQMTEARNKERSKLWLPPDPQHNS